MQLLSSNLEIQTYARAADPMQVPNIIPEACPVCTTPAPLHEAAFLGDVTTLERNLATGTMPVDGADDGKHTPLGRAVAGGDPACVALLLKAGADPSKYSGPEFWGDYPIMLACESGSWQIVQQLVEAGADVPVAALNQVKASGMPELIALVERMLAAFNKGQSDYASGSGKRAR